MTKRVILYQVEFLRILSPDGSNLYGIISVLTSPNKQNFEPKLYLHKSSFQRNKQCSKISSNEEIMTNLLKIAPKIEFVK